MSWLGKLVGGSWGLLFGGPIGAIIGGAAGHFLFDRQQGTGRRSGGFGASMPNTSAYGGSARASYNGEQIQAAYFVAVFSIFAKIAQADGVVSKEERDMVARIASQGGIAGQSRDFAMRVFEEAQKSPYSVRDFAQQLASITNGRPDVRNTFLDTLFRLAAVDGHVDKREIAGIRTVATALQIDNVSFDALLARYSDNADSAYIVLGCIPESSNEEIRTSYRHMVSEYHPDRIIARGLPDDFVELANQRFREIKEAYDRIKKSRGI